MYTTFLAPLEDGIYVRGGNPFHIKPCFWIFAGTKLPKPIGQTTVPGDLDDKGSDFQSRLTLDPFSLSVDPTDKERMDAASLEKIYISAVTIQRFFPDVQRLSSLALRAFELLPASIEPRAITRLVKMFHNVQYGKITSKNFPQAWHAEFEIDPAKLTAWDTERRKEQEGDDILIESNPAYDLVLERGNAMESRDRAKRTVLAGRPRMRKPRAEKTIAAKTRTGVRTRQ